MRMRITVSFQHLCPLFWALCRVDRVEDEFECWGCQRRTEVVWADSGSQRGSEAVWGDVVDLCSVE